MRDGCDCQDGVGYLLQLQLLARAIGRRCEFHSIGSRSYRGYGRALQIKGFPGREWATVAELAERLQAKHHGVVSLVTRCKAAGWVQRSASRNDKRCVEVHLTPEGEECLEQLARLHRDELRSVKAGFSVSGVTEPRAE